MSVEVPVTTTSELELEIVQLREALESRTVIGVATGLLAERYGSSSTQAWALLTRLSMNANIKVREIARVLVAQADGTLDDESTSALVLLTAHLPQARRGHARGRGTEATAS